MSENVNWVEIMSFYMGEFAEMARDILTSNSIPCLIQKDPVSTVYLTGGGGVNSRFAVFVPSEYSEEALQLLDNFQSSTE